MYTIYTLYIHIYIYTYIYIYIYIHKKEAINLKLYNKMNDFSLSVLRKPYVDNNAPCKILFLFTCIHET